MKNLTVKEAFCLAHDEIFLLVPGQAGNRGGKI
jgi:hypothetical protein